MICVPGAGKRVYSAVGCVLVLCCGLLASGCGRPDPPTKYAPPEVVVSSVVEENVPVYGEWVATLDGYVNADIRPQVSGYLIRQHYQEGAFVNKDDVLFEIDPRPFQAALDQATAQLAQAGGQLGQAQAQLGLAQINVARDTPLAAARAIPQSQLDNDRQARAQAEALTRTDQANIQAASAAVEQAKLNLGFTQVRSLIAGIAGIATTQIGNLVGPTSVLTTVSQVDPIKAYFPISEQEYLYLASRIGVAALDILRQNSRVPLQLTLANGSVYPHPGRIIFINREVDPQTGTIRVAGAFDNPGNVLRPGQFGRIRAMTSFRRGALLVPQTAVMELQGSYQIAVVPPDNKIDLRTVEMGDRVGTMWIVNRGLLAGERVVSEGTTKVREGEVVTPKLEKPAGGGR